MDSDDATRVEAHHSDRIVMMPETAVSEMVTVLAEANARLSETVTAQADELVSMNRELRTLRETWVPKILTA